VLVRLAWDPRTRDYLARRTKQGKSKKEVMRCLKRYVAREVYRCLTTPAVGQEPAALDDGAGGDEAAVAGTAAGRARLEGARSRAVAGPACNRLPAPRGPAKPSNGGGRTGAGHGPVVLRHAVVRRSGAAGAERRPAGSVRWCDAGSLRSSGRAL
jgi:hypothetical protein